MKKIKIYGLAFIISCSMFSCSDILDVNPVDSFTDAAVWSDLSLAEAYLNTPYAKIKSELQKGSRFASLTDEVYQMHSYGTENVTQGYLSPDNSSFGWEDDMWNPWKYNYDRIAEINLFMENIDNVPASNDAQKEWRSQLKGQGYFLRAFFYNNLFGLYGRIPIITHTYGLKTPTFKETRASEEAVAEYIALQCDSAAALLPVVYTDESYGRATKGGALAVKARTLLYLASPLFGTPSTEKWKAASDANKAVIDLKTESGELAYSLKTGITTSDEYAALFLDSKNPEVIFLKLFDSKKEAGENSSFLHQAPCGSGNGFLGWGTLQPTRDLVDKFQMKDGSNYVVGAETQYPWANRDIRLKANIFVDGDKWGYRTDNRVIEFFIGKKDANGKLEPGAYEGQDGPSGATGWNASKTGYLMRKFLNPNFDALGTNGNTTPWFFMRLSEFYLNYAECQIELGNTAEALTYINKVRTRAQMPAATGANIRAEYEYERQIELMFEGQRWLDIRRWKTAEAIYKKPIYGISIIRDGAGNKVYKRIAEPVQERKFYAPKNYWMPIPRAELRKAPQLDAAPYE